MHNCLTNLNYTNCTDSFKNSHKLFNVVFLDLNYAVYLTKCVRAYVCLYMCVICVYMAVARVQVLALYIATLRMRAYPYTYALVTVSCAATRYTRTKVTHVIQTALQLWKGSLNIIDGFTLGIM